MALVRCYCWENCIGAMLDRNKDRLSISRREPVERSIREGERWTLKKKKHYCHGEGLAEDVERVLWDMVQGKYEGMTKLADIGGFWDFIFASLLIHTIDQNNYTLKAFR